MPRVEELRASYSSNREGTPQRFGGSTGHDIRLVDVGTGDEQVRIGRTGLLKDLRVSAVPLDREDIEVVRQLIRPLSVDIDDSHVVTPGEGLGDRGAHFASADNDDVHSVVTIRNHSLLVRYPLETQNPSAGSPGIQPDDFGR